MSVPPPATHAGGTLHLAGAFVLVLALLLPVHAAAAQRGLSPQVYHALTRVHDLMDQGKYVTAEERLTELLGQLAEKGYDKAVALQTLAHVQAARERYDQAARSLQQSLALGALPDAVEQQGRYDLAQLYLASGKPGRAVEELQRWFEHAGQPSAEAQFLRGAAHVQLQQYRQANTPLKRAIEEARRAAKGEDAQAIKSALNELEQTSHALSKAMYDRAQAGRAGDEKPQPASTTSAGGADDAIDAEFEVKA